MSALLFTLVSETLGQAIEMEKNIKGIVIKRKRKNRT